MRKKGGSNFHICVAVIIYLSMEPAREKGGLATLILGSMRSHTQKTHKKK